MELAPRLQEVLTVIRENGRMSISDLALNLKVSYKTAKGYVRELERLGYVQEVGNDEVEFKEVGPLDTLDRIKKVVELHDSELYAMKKELEALKEEVIRLKRFSRRGYE